MFDKTKVAMERVEYTALLDGNGEIIFTAPLDEPFEIPNAQKVAGLETKIRVDVQINLQSR